MVWDGTACVAPTCPSGQSWNGTACVADCIPSPTNNQCPPLSVSRKLGTPGFAPDPASGKMYDAFGVQVPIPLAGYRHVGYAHSLLGIASVDMALNEATTVSSAPDGAVTSFEAPSVNGSAASSTNQFTVGLGNAIQMDFGVDPVSGLSWGRWQGNWVINNPAQGLVPAGAGSNLHWFVLPTQTQAITLPVTGTISYTYAGGTAPADNYGTLGTLTSATLNANFTAQQVNVSIGVSINTTTPIVTCTGCATAATGVIIGQFSQGGIGAGVGYGLQNGSQIINGAAVFHRDNFPDH